MQQSITVVDCFDHELEVRCTSMDRDPCSWQVHFWGPRGLRYAAHIDLLPGCELEQALQCYVDEHRLVASTAAP